MQTHTHTDRLQYPRFAPTHSEVKNQSWLVETNSPIARKYIYKHRGKKGVLCMGFMLNIDRYDY